MSKFSRIFFAFQRFFLQCQSLKDDEIPFPKLVPKLDSNVISFLKSVGVFSEIQSEFNLTQFLDLNKDIFGLRIPLSYAQAM